MSRSTEGAQNRNRARPRPGPWSASRSLGVQDERNYSIASAAEAQAAARAAAHGQWPPLAGRRRRRAASLAELRRPRYVVYEMKGESKICISDAVPLNSPAVTKVYLNTGNSRKTHSFDGPEIHLQKESNNTTDIDLHLNTTLSIKSSKKIRLLFMVNFLLCAFCFLIVGVIAFYYWKEMISMRHDMDLVKDQMLRQSFIDRTAIGQNILTAEPRLAGLGTRLETGISNDKVALSSTNMMLHEEPLAPVKSTDKPYEDLNNKYNSSAPYKDMFVVQFNGAVDEMNLGEEFHIGPWVLDKEVSTENSSFKIALSEDSKYMTVKESGLYLVYAQVVYLSYKPNCYFIWARGMSDAPRLISACGTGDDTSGRPVERAQMSCSTQAVARLYRGETILLVQREENTIVCLKSGYTYVGFVKLNS
ncbi:hypothetical protein EVAR_551_1 [Eumeta japonica]|uniref:THD domain-containing protein n=1 Tax=Eumeta variegata TaxID=151549 RepID=A0A4C1SAT9_EUMVA|nr:hypothetical protein EVAR_551_1 [Eumeta japonica]